jgi:DNA-binding NarL/FixJ family response regulator
MARARHERASPRSGGSECRDFPLVAIAVRWDAAGFKVVGQAADVDGLLELVRTAAPDVLVVDVRMPPTHTTEGLEAARQIRSDHPRMAILLLSQYIETRYAVELLRDDPTGIGYLLQDRVTRIDDLAEAVRRVAGGGSVIDPEVVARLLGRPRAHTQLDELTTREREILGLMAEGRSNQGIAGALVLDPKTIEGHVTRIFSKLGLEPGARRPPSRVGGAQLPAFGVTASRRYSHSMVAGGFELMS